MFSHAHDTDRQRPRCALVGYALIVVMVAIASLATIKSVSQTTSQSFEAVATTFPGGVAESVPELTPSEKWAQAKADYDTAIADAKATKASEVAAAKTTYNSAVQQNKSLPNAERKAANKAAKTDYKAAKSSANTSYKSASSAAKAAKKVAKAEYNATK